MTDRLSNVEARIGSVRQLSAVVTAMRGIAAARSREAKEHLDGIRSYSAMIANAIGSALSFLPAGPAVADDGKPDGHAIVAFCAGQGFAGTFSERVLDAVGEILAQGAGDVRALIVGDRGLVLAGEHGLIVEWSAPMVAHIDQVSALADRIVEALYERLETGVISRVTLIYTALSPMGEMTVVRRQVIPFDYGKFPATRADPPLTTLPLPRLLAQLAEEYVFTEICEALTISFAAENEARTRAMVAAKTNVGKTLDGLVTLSRQLRQEEITNEIIELSAGRPAQG